MKHRTLIFVLLLSLSFRITAQEKLIPIPLKEKLELLDPYGNHANWKEDPNDITSWISYDEALDEWEWAEGENPPDLWMKADSTGKNYQVYKGKNQLLSEEKYVDLCLIYHPANEKYYIRFKDPKTKAYGLMDPSGQLLVEPKYSFLEILPWGNKNFDPLFLYSTKVSNNYFTKLSEVNEQANVFGTLNADNGKTSIEQFFKVFILPHAERYFCATLISKDSIHYALHSKYFDALTPPIFERTEVLKEDWTFENETLGETEEAGIARPLYYNTVIDQSTIILQKKGKKVVYDYDGNQMIAPKWDTLSRGPHEKLYLCKNQEDSSWVLANVLGEQLLTVKDKMIFFEELNDFIYTIGGRGEEGVHFAFFDENFQAITDYILNSKKALTLEESYDPMSFEVLYDSVIDYRLDVDSSLEGCFLLRQSNKAVVYDYRGMQLIPPIWDSIEATLNSEVWKVDYEGYKGFIDPKGDLLLKANFLSLQLLPWMEGLYFLAKGKDGKYTIINQWGKKLRKGCFEDAYINSEMKAVFLSKKNDEFAFFNAKLKRKSRYHFTKMPDLSYHFDSIRSQAVEERKMLYPSKKYVDTSAQRIILQTTRGQGLFDWDAQTIIPPIYQKIRPLEVFTELYYVAAKADGEWMVFDKEGKVYTDFNVVDLESDEDGKIYYMQNEHTKVIIMNLNK